MSLWDGKPDATAPEGTVPVGSNITITIGVQPAYVSNKVDLHYRINQAAVETVAAQPLRHDLARKAYYYSAHLPVLHVGDAVKYTAVCHYSGRQVPSPEEVKQFASSFHVVAVGSAESKPVAGSTIKESSTLKADGTDSYNTATRSSASIASPLKAPPAEPSSGPTKDDPLPQNEAQKAALKSLLSTSPVIADARLQDTFINLYAEHQGPIQNFWSKLREQPDFKEPGKIEQLQLTLQLDAVTQHHLQLINALQGLHQQGTWQSAHDLTKLDANGWMKLINSAGGGSVPPHIPGTTQEEKVANYVSSIKDTLQRAFPTSYVAQNVATSPEIDLNLVRKILARTPQIIPAHPLPDKLDWGGISEADQVKAKASMEALRQEIKMFPGFDYKTALAHPVFQNPQRGAISQFFGNAPDFDFRTAHVDTYLAVHEDTALKDIDPQHKAVIAAHLKMMQRVFQVAPVPEHMKTLLGEGLHSAQSIASIPQATFIKQFSNKLGGEAQASAIHTHAQDINAQTMHIFTQVYP